MRDRLRLVVLWGAVLSCAAPVACSRGQGGSSGGGLLGTSTRTDLLLEGTGLETLRIGEATVADASSRLDLPTAEWTRTFDNGLVEMRTPMLLKLSFLPPETGEGPARLYAVRAGLWEPVYTGKTSKGIGFLDTLDAVVAAYGPSDAEWVQTNHRLHYYGQHGVIITTTHPRDVTPVIYAKACATLGKQPDEGSFAPPVVTAILVVPPFTVTRAAEVAMARQQVISTRPETTLRLSEF
jgi:hypothetical protein